jgi:hypothetical protein
LSGESGDPATLAKQKNHEVIPAKAGIHLDLDLDLELELELDLASVPAFDLASSLARSAGED